MAATWLMMSLEGPFLAAVIARLAEAKFNLAAWGVAYAFALLFEAPVIMIMSASTALVEDATSYRKLRNFTFALSGAMTIVMGAALLPPVFDLIAFGLIGLPPQVARLTQVALLILLPWPGSIGYRRFYQGLLIRDGRTRWVAYGTVLRLVAMGTAALLLYLLVAPPGAYVGAAALTAGVCTEGVAARLMARPSVRERLTGTAQGSDAGLLDYRRIAAFYYPLALTSLLGLAAHPLVTFFLGRARFAVESLAVLPVVNALTFIFRSMGLSYQEVAIALLGRRYDDVGALGRFAFGLGLASSLALALVGFTPLAGVWFRTISGLTPELTAFAIPPTRILVALPALSVLLSFQRAILVRGHRTGPITIATALEIAGIALVITTLIHGVGLVGVTAAAIAYLAGRLVANGYLIAPCRKLLGSAKRATQSGRTR